MNSSSDSAARFTEVLVGRFPYLEPLLREHLRDFEELLPHLFFGDLTRYVVAAFCATDVRDRSRWHLSELLDELEGAISGDDEAISELVAVSFVENLPGPDEPAGDLHRLLGPGLRAQYDRIWQQR